MEKWKTRRRVYKAHSKNVSLRFIDRHCEEKGDSGEIRIRVTNGCITITTLQPTYVCMDICTIDIVKQKMCNVNSQ